MTEVVEGLKGGLAPLVVFVCGVLTLLSDLGGSKNRFRSWGSPLAVGGLLAGALIAFVQGAVGGVRLAPLESVAAGGLFGGAVIQDGFSAISSVLIGIAAALVLAMGEPTRQSLRIPAGEFRALLLFASAGAMWMAQSVDLVTAFVSVEILSVAVYVLVGISRRGSLSGEAAVKYFLLGAFASAFLLFGICLTYGSVGLVRNEIGLPLTPSLTNLGVISETLVVSADKSTPLLYSPLFAAGLAMLLVGLGFKASLVPFHQYAPDVFEGAPTPVAAFLSTVTKFAAFAVIVRVIQAMSVPGVDSKVLVAVTGTLGVVSILVGNGAALGQVKLRRIIAFSSTAHAGYLLLGSIGMLGSRSQLFSSEAVLGYLLAYGIANIGIFGVLMWLGNADRPVEDVSDLHGLAHRHRGAAVVLTILLLSLSGIPLTYGFIAKLGLFIAVVDSGHIAMALVGLVLSGIGIAVYLRLIIAIFFRTPSSALLPAPGGVARLVAVAAACGTVILGLVPMKWIDPVPTPTAKPSPMPSQLDSRPVPSPGGN